MEPFRQFFNLLLSLTKRKTYSTKSKTLITKTGVCEKKMNTNPFVSLPTKVLVTRVEKTLKINPYNSFITMINNRRISHTQKVPRLPVTSSDKTVTIISVLVLTH